MVSLPVITPAETEIINGPAEPETLPMSDPELYQNHRPTYIESKSPKDRALYSMDSETPC